MWRGMHINNDIFLWHDTSVGDSWHREAYEHHPGLPEGTTHSEEATDGDGW